MGKLQKPLNVVLLFSEEEALSARQLEANLGSTQSEGLVQCISICLPEANSKLKSDQLRSLRRTNVLVLLLSPSFVDKAHAVDRELKEFRSRERDGADLLPVRVKPYEYGNYWISDVKYIDYRKQCLSLAGDEQEAWSHVAREIRIRVGFLLGMNPVRQVLSELDETAYSADRVLPQSRDQTDIEPLNFQTVSRFWRSNPTDVSLGMLMSVKGTFSRYGPLIYGNPAAKRELHRSFRQAIERRRKFGEKKLVTINACLSLSSGQMIGEDCRERNGTRICGLYESIARNSIPVRVDLAYLKGELQSLLSECGGDMAFEATVTGILIRVDNEFILRWLTTQSITSLLPRPLLDTLSQSAFALAIGGPNTGIMRHDEPTRYVDGDVWYAADSNQGERFFTGFVDITSQKDREAEAARLSLEIAGNPIINAFDRLEEMEDRRLSATARATSKNTGRDDDESLALSLKRTILFLSANPQGTEPLGIHEEAKKIELGLRRSKMREHWNLVTKFAVTVDELLNALLDHEPEIVHFSGHGASASKSGRDRDFVPTGGRDGLAFVDEDNQANLVSGEALSRLFKLCSHHIRCVVLNACSTSEQADAIAQYIDVVIGTQRAIGDRAAIQFAVGFYEALGAGRDIEKAFEFGRSAIELKGLPERLTPIIRKRSRS